MRSIRSPLDGFASPFGRRASGGDAFSVDLTGLSTDGLGTYGQVGGHASIGYTTDPVSATETVKWSASSNPADAATFGTGASPTDFAVADGFSVYLHVTDGGETVTRSFTARYAPGTASAIADGQTWTVDDTAVNLDASASGANLTLTYELSGADAGVAINASNGLISGTPIAVGSGTATATATDQYGRTYVDTFTWTASLRAQATAGAALDLSFVEDSAITSTDLAQNFTENGNTLTYLLVDTPPAGLSATGQTLTGTPTTITADANYTFQGTDEYGRVVSVEHAIEITDPVPAPALLPWSDGPVITGTLTQGAELTFSLGQWENATSFEIELVSATPTATLLARQSATGDTTGSFTADVGATLTLRVWATGPGGTTLEESAPFGPIEAAVTTLIEAFSIAGDPSLDYTPAGFPVTVNKLDVGGTANTRVAAYDAGVGWGWVGTQSLTSGGGMSHTDPRLRSRLSSNVDAAVRVDLAPGQYRIYLAAGAASTIAPNIRVLDYSGNTFLSSTLLSLSGTSVGANQILDATGVVRSSEDWVAESVLGGAPATITVAGDNIRITRINAAPQLIYFAVEEVA